MKIIVNTVLTLAIALQLGACGNNRNSNNTPAPQPKDTSAVKVRIEPEVTSETPTTLTWPEIKGMHNNELVTVEGYLRLPNFMYIGSKKLEIDLFERPNQKAGYRLICSIPTGSIDNTSNALGKQYTAADFKINTYNGETIRGEGAYVRLTGRLDVFNSGHGTLTEVTKIEKADRKNIPYEKLNVPEFKAENSEKLDGKLVYVEGRLDPGTYLSTYNNAYSFIIEGLKMDKGDVLIAFINIGRRNSEVQDIPESFSAKDIIIRDGAGNIFPIDKKVKVYGTYSKSSIGNGGSLYVEHIVVQ